MVRPRFFSSILNKKYIEVKKAENEDDYVNGINIRIGIDGGDYEFLYLDKSTAIKFSKEIRKQIALLD
jgi:hypothetical protein